MEFNSNIINHKSYDKLLSEFHPTLNEDLKLSDFNYGSHKKVWWKCDAADDHIWNARINHRINGVGCPCCSNKKTVLSNCLATTHPKIAKRFHPIKNEKLTPYDITFGSHKKVWWICDKEKDHEWEAYAYQLNDNYTCPCCTGRKTVISNCLYTTHPEISKQWHPTKNGNLTPFDVSYGSKKKVWWKCDKELDHEWEAYIFNQANRTKCSCCSGKTAVLSNCLYTTHPELSKQWHPTKNGSLTQFSVTFGSNKKAWWVCENLNNHEWSSVIASRTGYQKVNCPYCNESKGEKKISDFLNKNKIKFQTQKRYDNCRNINTLPFDFYLINYNILIEYDGIFHYKPIEFVGGIKHLKDLKKRDKIKNEYCKNNNIPLLRIPYTEFNDIENILIKFLSNNCNLLLNSCT